MSPRTLAYKIRNLPNRIRGWKAEILTFAKIGMLSELTATIRKSDGTLIPLGVISRRVITDAGVGYIVDAFQNLVELESMNYHGSGTGVAAEAVGNTALGTETGTRVAGTQTETAANILKTTALISYSSTLAITEHGIFSASSAGVLLDRSVFTAINVINGDSITFAYSLTLTSGG